jgi:hypothetical protein
MDRAAGLFFLFVLMGGSAWSATVPAPLPDHPGHVFAEGERLAVARPPSFTAGAPWVLRTADGADVARGVCGADGETIDAGAQPVGWYRLESVGAYTTAAVVRRLAAPVPTDSPVRIDTANAWFTRTKDEANDRRKMAAFASLAALAGVSGVRDRMTWGELETAPGVFRPGTRYDDSARILGAAGLQVLQVFHSTPAWARTPRLEADDAGNRYPRDLRDSYRFCKAMAERFKGRVQAWEPWNEANIPGFGGQIIDEMCSLQKASYLGFKAGDPNLTVCWNVFAGPGTALHAQGVLNNACWPYFDTYDIHSYSGVEQYLSEFSTARIGACGRPLWISECGVHVQWNAEHGDLSDAEELRQARFVPKSYVSSLFAGVSRHYFFILGNYCEGKVQFGLLRHDLTPRRGYLALAATGRLLAGAQSLGRLTNGALRVYALRAQPDDATRDVLVAWSEKGDASTAAFAAGLPVQAVYDVYGRALVSGLPASLNESPLFIVLPEGASQKLALERPRRVEPAPRTASASTVVMQALVPQERTRLDVQAHRVAFGTEDTVPVAVYNFGGETVRGVLRAEAPAGWRVALPTDRVELRPMERQVLAVRVTASKEAGRSAIFGAPVTLRGTFGSAGETTLAFRLVCDADAVAPTVATPVAAAVQPEAWVDNIVGGAKMTHAVNDGRMVFDMSFGDQDPWGYPRLKLAAADRPPPGTDGLMADIDVLEGEGTLRVQFVEAGGATYLGELPYRASKGGRQTLVAFFEKANWVSYSQPDADGHITPSELGGVMIGLNAKCNSHVRLAVSNVRWVRYGD